MSRQTTPAKHDGGEGRAGGRFWLLVACSLPPIVFFALIALKVIW